MLKLKRIQRSNANKLKVYLFLPPPPDEEEFKFFFSAKSLLITFFFADFEKLENRNGVLSLLIIFVKDFK